MKKKYKHFKGGEYEFIDIAVHSESKEKMVLYRSCADNNLYVRPYDMFFETVDVDGQQVPRFKEIKD